MPRFVRCCLAVCLALTFTLAREIRAQNSPVVAPLLKLLAGGKVPPAGQATLVEMICNKGEAGDLAAVLARLQEPGGFDPKLQPRVIELLADAATNRKLKPAGDLSGLGKLVAQTENPALQLGAIRLAALWKLASIAEPLQKIVASEQASAELRRAAIEGLANIGDEKSRGTIRQLAAGGNPPETRVLAISSWARFDLDGAARAAADLLATAPPSFDPAPLFEALLSRQDGSDKLAAALAGVQLNADAAKVCLRTMYSVGHADAALSDVLSKAAGIAADMPPPTQEEVAKIAAEVLARGDAARGEKIFRRADLSCLKCHAIAQAGGNVGPELTAVGSISPVDYIVNSILNPNLAIKEQYVTRKVLTVDGEVLVGIQVDRDDQRLRLRDAAGKLLVIPTSDIEQEGEGRSLMPQGLTKFLTHDEFLDLARFVSELGKPGEYAIRKTPAIQRWQVLRSVSPELAREVPNVETLRLAVLDAPATDWATSYSRADGVLPLAELAPRRPAVLFVQGAIDVSQPGKVTAQVASTEKAVLWIDAEPFENPTTIERELAAGRHTFTLRIEVGDRPEPELKVELSRPPGSTAQFVPVGGN
ncbi:MAG: hypothetical protein SFU86_13965 [Pirellulaceae bacterium]|nr:hypothetical protein [Pirellulaceae bacterium]